MSRFFMRAPRRAVSSVVALGLGMAALSGCGGSDSKASSDTFTMAVSYGISSFNPYTSREFGYLTSVAYDSLVNLTPEGDIVSGLAEEWETTATSATFTLKSGITCSDGTELTATQVAASLEWVADPAKQSWMYGVLTPPTPFKVVADDPARKVTVTLDSPFSFLLETLGASVPIVCEKGLADPGSLDKQSAGTGPFVLKSVSNDSYTFTKRDGYTWGPDGASTDAAGTPKELVFKVVPSETTAASLLLSGDINASIVMGPDYKRLDAAGLKHVDSPALAGQMQINVRKGRVTADEQVRRALVQAVDLDELTAVETGGRGIRATSLLSENPAICPGDVTDSLPEHDQDAAEETLDAAGWIRDGDGVRKKNGAALVVDLHYPAVVPSSKAAAEFLAARWKKVGVEAKLSGDSESAVQQAIFTTSDFDIYLAGFQSNLPSALMPFVSGAEPPKGFNIPGAHYADYDRLVAQAIAQSGRTGCEQWNQAAQVLVDDLVMVPYANNPVTTFTSGATFERTGIQYLTPTSIKMSDDQ